MPLLNVYNRYSTTHVHYTSFAVSYVEFNNIEIFRIQLKFVWLQKKKKKKTVDNFIDNNFYCLNTLRLEITQNTILLLTHYYSIVFRFTVSSSLRPVRRRRYLRRATPAGWL